MKKVSHYVVVLLLVAQVLWGLSCAKSRPVVTLPADTTYSGRIQFVLQYNAAEFSDFYKFLQDSGRADALGGQGPFTVFAPNNTNFTFGAFNGYYENLDSIGNYILTGLYPLTSILPGQTQIINATNGYKFFVSCTVSRGSLVYSVNGSVLGNVDQKASNGLIEVLERDINPTYYRSYLDAIESNVDWSLFAYAVKRANLRPLLTDSTKIFTVMIPSNESLQSAGYTLDSITNADPDSLALNLVQYHILPGRFFLNDFFMQYQGDGQANDTLLVNTLKGENIQVIVNPQFSQVSNYNMYNAPQFLGLGGVNAASVNPPNYAGTFDLPAGQGVVHGMQNYYLIP